MCKKGFYIFIALLLLAVCQPTLGKSFTLVIDAGHGGHDQGAPGTVSLEKDINLKVALAFGKYVENNCPDVRVIYTRKTDVFIPLKERANIANRNKADLFISVHTNALPHGKIARGFETYTLGMHRAKDNLDVAMRENSVIMQEKNYEQTYQGFNPSSSESYIIFELMQSAYMERSVDLASMIQKSVCAYANRPDKGVHQAGFLVLRETSMPSCLIELGFITTPDEEEQLNDDSQIDLIAHGIYNAFLTYKNKYANGGVTDLKEGARAVVGNQPASSVAPVAKKAQADSDSKASSPARQTTKPTATSQRTDPKKETAKTDTRSQIVAKKDKASKSTIDDKDKQPTTPKKTKTVAASQVKDAPEFRVQIFAGSHKLRFNDSRFKGLQNCQSIDDGKTFRYTYGSSTNYNEINRLRKQILDKFPDAFIIALKKGKIVDVNQAIQEFLKNKGK